MSKNMNKNFKPMNENTPVVETENKVNNIEEKVEVEVTENVMEQEVKIEKKEEKKEPQINKSEVEKKTMDTIPTIKVGDKVKIKKTTTETVVGQPIKKYLYRNTYKVEKILPKRVIISASPVTKIPVTIDDIELVK